MTQLDQAIGEARIVTQETLSGPRGGRGWERLELSDGRMALRGPDVRQLPKWLRALAPTGQQFVRAGGTTYEWSGWISGLAA